MGEKFAKQIARREGKNSLVIGLSGDLGSGKTTFVQGFAKGLGLSSRIVSPTFILMRSYLVGEWQLYHVDLYRIEGNIKTQIDEIGLPSIWQNPKSIMLIEWAEKAKGFLPSWTKWIEFKHLDGDKREIRFK